MAFLVFEGVDGAGKTTLIKALTRELKKKGIIPLITKEPGGTKSGTKIRRILLKKTASPPSPQTEILLYYADRSQNIRENIEPSLKKSQWVISDRYWASTAAYQYGGRKTGKKLIDYLTREICGNYQPDLWILLNLPLKESLNRLNQKDRFEEEKISFHRKIKAYYLKLAKSQPDRWLVLSGLKTQRELVDIILNHLLKKKFIKP